MKITGEESMYLGPAQAGRARRRASQALARAPGGRPGGSVPLFSRGGLRGFARGCGTKKIGPPPGPNIGS